MEKIMRFPELRDPQLAYETGLHIGDGCLSYSKSKNLYGIYYSGNSETDFDFFSKTIPQIIQNLYGLKVHVEMVSGEKSIRLRIYSKKLFAFKKDVLGLPVGNKSRMKNLPEVITSKGNIIQLIAGIFDTDGCFKTVKKEGKLYPRITIANKSIMLEEIKIFLIKNGIPCHIYQDKKTLVYCLSINGNKNVDKFFDFVKPLNQKHLARYKVWTSNRDDKNGLVA